MGRIGRGRKMKMWRDPPTTWHWLIHQVHLRRRRSKTGCESTGQRAACTCFISLMNIVCGSIYLATEFDEIDKFSLRTESTWKSNGRLCKFISLFLRNKLPTFSSKKKYTKTYVCKKNWAVNSCLVMVPLSLSIKQSERGVDKRPPRFSKYL